MELIPTLVVLVVVIIVPPTPTFRSPTVDIPLTLSVVADAVPSVLTPVTLILRTVASSNTRSSLM